MIIALLFNSDAPEYGGYYGGPINRKVVSTGVLQESDRHMKMSVGDVLIYSHSKTWSDYDELCERVYFAHTWGLLHEARPLEARPSTHWSSKI
jgi:hypothetical protein